MKILYHHRTASKDGQAVHIEELIASLRALGHEVRVVAPAPSGGEGMGAEVGWVQRLRALLPKAIYELLELAYSFVAYTRLVRAASEFKPDVIYERYNLYLLAGLMLKRRTGLPLLLEVNAPLAQERGQFGGLGLPFLARWAEGVVWRGASFVLPVTRVLALHVAARGVSEKRIVVIPNGINEAHFSRVPTPAAAKQALGWPDALVLGFTGFVREWHGVDRVLHWMASDDAPDNARLLVVGVTPDYGPRCNFEFWMVRDLRSAGVQAYASCSSMPKDEPLSRAAIERMRVERLQNAEAASKRFSQALADVAEVLTPAQRKQLAERIQRHRGMMHHG